MMQPKRLFICVLVGFIGLMPVSIYANEPITIHVVTTFEYPGGGNSTTPFGINNRGDIAGDYVDSSKVQRGFVRFRNGSFSPPIVAPNDTGNITRGLGINDFRTVTLTFFNVTDNLFHGGFLKGGVFSQFDLGSFGASVNGINDVGHFVGTFGSPLQGFLQAGGKTTVINVPGASFTRAIGINNADLIVGRYTDGSLADHGYIRNRSGSFTFPIDFPGAIFTTFQSVNDLGWIVGNYQDASGHTHGFLLIRPDTFVSFDFPNAASTSLNGINDEGFISGRYTDSAGVRHGLLARVRRDDDDEDNDH